MAKSNLNVMIGGAAGQGLVTVGQLLSKVLVRSGYYICVTQSYQSRIRGGHNTFTIRAAKEPIAAGQEQVDLLLALNQETLELHGPELGPGGLVVLDSKLDASGYAGLPVPFAELADKRYGNTLALGVAAWLLGLEHDLVLTALGEAFAKHPEKLAENQAALDAAMDWTRENSHDFSGLAPAEVGGGRLMLGGNEAIALGAMSAGLKFLSFYPMTPSTSVALNVVAHAEELGLVVEQAEDEIAALNMALGASFAGAPAMVTTSGGGFALMSEAVSLAGMTETPVVIMVAMRPGPATGLPTRSEQGDLEFVLHAGHGEFPRAILTPGSVEECFHLAHQAFKLAERFQGPVFLLTDQYLADSYRAVEPFDLESLEPISVGSRAAGNGDYQRYAPSQSGVSPRLLPGAGKELVVVDSDEHTPDGHITEDLKVRLEMNQKRLAKLAGLRDQALAPVYQGPDSPELLLVSWGSTAGPAAEAASHLRDQGQATATLHFQQVWPLNPDDFLARLEAAGRAVCIEGNAQGQLARLLRRECGFEFAGRVLRYDGLPFTPQYILRELAK